MRVGIDHDAAEIAKYPHVVDQAPFRRAAILETIEKNGYKLLKDLMLLADFNPAEILKADGSLKVKSLADLGEKAKCIKSIEKTREGIKITLEDRAKFMQMYLRYLNLIKPEVLVEEQLKVVAMVPKAESVEEWNDYADKNDRKAD